jgi:8-oxo-dGTP pyrophosphatase MutT (NUDIX family)
MKLERIRDAFVKQKRAILDVSNEYSVLLPLIYIENELHVLFQVRSYALNNQPGEICFPGGRIEATETPLESAVRETAEELNISLEQIEVLGELDLLVTPFNTVLFSFCGILRDIGKLEDINFNRQEVAEVFTVPLKELLDMTPILFTVEISVCGDEEFPYHLIEKGRDYKWKSGAYPVYFYQYKDYMIWGLTAKILKHFLSLLQD